MKPILFNWVFVIEFERISKDEALGGGGDG